MKIWGFPVGTGPAHDDAKIGPAMVRRLEGEPVPNLDERVAYLEGRLEDHSGSVNALRVDLRLGIERLDTRMDGLEARMDRLDDKVSRHFTWLVGIQVGVLIAVIGALLGR